MAVNVERQKELAQSAKKNWGNRPWVIDFRATKHAIPASVDFAVVGGGFCGLAAAAWLRKLAPDKTVALFESGGFGAGSSGNTGGIALAETAAGDMPGLGDVLAGYRHITTELGVNGDLVLPGCYELSRSKPQPKSPIQWKDSGDLCVTKEVPGGTIDPGKTVAGLARAAERAGVLLFEQTGVQDVQFRQPIELHTNSGSVQANKVLFATNALSTELTGLKGSAQTAFTTAILTRPLDESVIDQIGLRERKPFYTVDLPYLWGRLLGNAVMFGAGLIFFEDWRELDSLDIEADEAQEVFSRLERRVRHMSPPLRDVQFAHRWGGPICITQDWEPVFRSHAESENAIVLGGFSGHGVALSVYLGTWAAEAMLGRRALPGWD
jgi:glycine/D-amino acid oxidase-like deaminating enzyme